MGGNHPTRSCQSCFELLPKVRCILVDYAPVVGFDYAHQRWVSRLHWLDTNQLLYSYFHRIEIFKKVLRVLSLIYIELSLVFLAKNSFQTLIDFC